MNGKNKYIFCRDSYTGEGGYSNDGSYSYLNPFPTESSEFFKDRRKNTILDNIYKPMLNLFYSPISSKSIDVVVNTENKDVKNVIKQTKLLSKSNKALLDIIKYDISLFSVSTDITDDGEPDLNMYPDIATIFPADVEELVLNGLEVYKALYTEYQFYKDIKIPISVEYESNLFLKTTKAWYDANGNIVLKDLGEANRVTMFDAIKYGVFSKLGEELGETPYSYDLARSQLKIYNQDSDTRSTLRKNGYPTLMWATDADLEDTEDGASTGIRVGADDKFPEFLEADLHGVEIGIELIQLDKEQIYKTHTSGLLSSTIVYNSATSSAIASKAFQNTVNVYYNYYKEILETMIDSVIFIYNLNTTYNIDYPEMDINETSMSDEIEKII